MSRHNPPTTIFAFALGVGIGAVAGLLLAPKTGEDLREDLTTAAGNGVDHLRSQSQVVKKRAQELVDAAKDQLQNAVNEGEDAYKQAKKAGA
jgi:gas vesicle protein